MSLKIFALISLIVFASAAKTSKKGSIFENKIDSISEVRITKAFKTSQVTGTWEKTVKADSFQCGTQSYLSYADLLNNQNWVCQQLNARGIDRLQAGSSVGGPAYQCRNRLQDGRDLAGGICVSSTISSTSVQSGTSCPAGYDVATLNEAAANSEAWCRQLGAWGIARVGVMGTIYGMGYNCKINQADVLGVGNVICVKRALSNLKIIHDSNEFRCGTGNSLLSAAEVKANVNTYCTLLGNWDIVRLQGGGSLSGLGYNCAILNENKASLAASLCAPEAASRTSATINAASL